jgi:hypothetical protein
MDPRPKLHQLKMQRAAAFAELQQLRTHPDRRKFETKASEIETLDELILRQEKTLDPARAGARLTAAGELPGSDGWKNLGEQLRAIVRASYPGGQVDPRLIKAPAGMGETDPSGGGVTIAPSAAITQGNFLRVLIPCEIKKIRSAVPRGGFRPGAGRKKKPRPEICPNRPKAATSPAALAELGEELIARFLSELAAAITAEELPLKQRVVILRNLLAARRLLCDAAHPAPAPGKKETAAKVAGEAARSGRFATPPPPKLAVDNTR